MAKEKYSFKSVLAIALVMIQIVLCLAPTFYIDAVDEDDYYDERSIEIDRDPFGVLSAMQRLGIYSAQFTAYEEEAEYRYARSDDLQEKYDSFSEYWEDVLDNSNQFEDDESSGSLTFKMFMIVIPLMFAILYLVLSMRTKTASSKFYYSLAASATLFVLANLVSLLTMDIMASDRASSEIDIESSLNIFGWLSVGAAVVQWVLYFTSISAPVKPLPAEFSHGGDLGSSMPEASKLRVSPGAISKEPVVYEKSDAPVITPRVYAAPTDSIICPSCGTNLHAECTFCPRCGTQVK